ncbi:Relaxase/Mobilisation nuclease domain-containing protein [Cupriavidus sp. YR651]|uniref:TraI/MobA(P) family conjugative relaxase n=1 Tax=Cupriavidus sp. YR651 TaxID=1855315 RepID=UPI00088BEB10|nr:TraI/MobA(P) family conjugative relaxase [Cupriavidus sp. YR651]SDC19744.1 Relaxase/Mobilisation nuclease domain-containing protein [Cupriavidus sp. YR651]
MIGKKVHSSKVKNKAASVRDLADYIRKPERLNPQEKVIYANGRAFITDSHAAQREEMVALASEAVRSKNPVNHYILSWREGEQPNPEQIEEAVTIFLDELGLAEHQAIYALHADTDNRHLHIAVNRVHPDTLKVVKINRGFDIEAVHRAVARIEHAQGWQREQRGRYRVQEDGGLGREHIEADRQRPRQPGQRKRDMENRTGEKSAERIAIEEGAPIIKRAQSWEQLHRELAEKGMRYVKKGSGAMIFVGEVGVKASSVDRGASLAKLQKRLGPYRPPSHQERIADRQPEPINPDAPRWREYIAGRKAHYASKAAEKQAQGQRQQQERLELSARLRARRNELLRGPWRGRGDALNALRSVIAAEQAAEKAAMSERHRRERDTHRQRFRSYPDLEAWYRLQEQPDLAEQWRYRASGPQGIEGDSDEPATPRDIRAYAPAIVGRQVQYLRREGPEADWWVAFVDKGKRIEIHDWRNPEATLAALQLAAQKWGSFTVTGNDEYKAMCTRLAAAHGFKIRNPELQEAIQVERLRIRQQWVRKPRTSNVDALGVLVDELRRQAPWSEPPVSSQQSEEPAQEDAQRGRPRMRMPR